MDEYVTWCDQCAHGAVCAVRFSQDKDDERAMTFCDDFLCRYVPICVVCGREAVTRVGMDVRDQCCVTCKYEKVEDENGDK